LPIQAKGGTDKIGIVQIEQDFAVLRHKVPSTNLPPHRRSVYGRYGNCFILNLSKLRRVFRVSGEKHYRLVHPDYLTLEELESYRRRPF